MIVLAPGQVIVESAGGSLLVDLLDRPHPLPLSLGLLHGVVDGLSSPAPHPVQLVFQQVLSLLGLVGALVLHVLDATLCGLFVLGSHRLLVVVSQVLHRLLFSLLAV